MINILKEYKVLYAEDDIELKEQMSEYFENYFKEVVSVSNGKDALEVYKSHKPEVVFLDIYMPELNGLELTQYIRKENHNTKIVIISAHSQSDLMLEAINSNVNYYIIKPATIDKIKDMMYKISFELARDSKDIIILNEDYKYFKLTSKLYRKDKEINLSFKEKKLLEILIKNKGNEVSINNLILFAWGDDNIYETTVDSVKTQVSYLRKKLPKNCIKTVYGGGYTLV